jgi:hypothetical protein
MITPGGMILETPQMIAARDSLTIVASSSSALCFEVVTFSRNRDRCEISGSAVIEAPNDYVFREGEVALRLVQLGSGEIRVQPIGAGYRKRCAASGRIDDAIYTSAREHIRKEW